MPTPSRQFRPYTRPKSQRAATRKGFWQRLMAMFTSDTPLLRMPTRSRRRNSSRATVEQLIEEREQALNRRLIRRSIISVIVLAVALGAWHHWQASRLPGMILRKAEGFEASGDWLEAAEWRRRYVALRPDDFAARLKLAETYDQAAVTSRQRALLAQLYSEALGGTGDVSDTVRRRLAELQLEIDQPDRALDNANVVLELSATDPVALRIRAEAMEQLNGKTKSISAADAAAAMRQALDANRNDVRLARRLATLYRTRLGEPSAAEREEMADAVMDRLVLENPDSPAAYLARYDYRREFNRSDSDADLQRALELEPDSLDALMASGQRALERRQFDRAIEHYQRVIELSPKTRDGYLGLGRSHSAAGQIEEAIAAFHQGLERVDRTDIELGFALVRTLLDTRRLDEIEPALSEIDLGISRESLRLTGAARETLLRRRDDLHAEWHMQAGRDRHALPLLRTLVSWRENRLADPENVAQLVKLHHELAHCYRDLYQPDLEAQEYEAAGALDRAVPDHPLHAAEAWLRSGRIDGAIEQLNAVLSLPNAPPRAEVLMARAQLLRQLRLPPAERDWKHFDAALARAKSHEIPPEEVAIVCVTEADALNAQGRTKAALELLDTAVAAHPKVPLLGRAMVLAQEKWGRRPEVDRWLERIEREAVDDRDVILLRAAVLCVRLQYSAAIELLNGVLSFLEPERQQQVERQIAQVQWQAGPFLTGRDAVLELGRTYPEDVLSLGIVGRFSLDVQDMIQGERLESQLFEIERPAGTQAASLWRGLRARFLLLRQNDMEEITLAEVGQLQKRLESIRPFWSQTHVIRGLISQRRQQYTQAVSALQTALECGETSLMAIGPLMEVLQEQGFDREAERYLWQLEDDSLAHEMPNLDVDTTGGYGEGFRAVNLARDNLARDPGDPQRLMRLGRALSRVRLLAESEQMLRRATQLAPDQPETWISLIRFYASSGQTFAGKQVLEELAALEEVDLALRAAILGQCYELIGEFDLAAQAHLAAAQRAPNDSEVLTRAAALMLSRDPQIAEQILRRVVELDRRSLEPRRWLARLLARRGEEQSIVEALGLLTKDRAQTGVTAFDLRLSARAFAEMGTTGERQLALNLLSELALDAHGLTTSDRLLMASLLWTDGQLSRAHREYELVLEEQPQNPDALAGLVDVLIGENLMDDAATRLAQLQQIGDPDRLRLVRLEALLAKSRDETADVVPIIERRLDEERNTQQDRYALSQFLSSAAELYQQLGYPEASERCLREVLALDPPSYPALANLLVLEDRVPDAIDLCLRAAESDYSPQPALVLGQVLVSGRANGADVARLAPQVVSSGERFPRHAGVLFTIGFLRAMQGNADAGINFFRRVLAVQPNHVPARNYLARLLATKDDGLEEAALMVEQAIALSGPLPTLLDTQGVIQMRQGKLAEAAALFRRAAADRQATPLQLLHLAQALEQQGSVEEAKAALARATEDKLRIDCLLPVERAAATSLVEALGG